MKKIKKEVVDQSMNYAAYRQLIDDLFAENKTTGDNHSEAFLHYTKMNIARMNRLDKTTRLTKESIVNIMHIERPLIWLVLTEAWCGDAAQILPVMNKLANENEHIELRMILRDEHLGIMDAFLTNGGRSIPKLICLDAETLDVLGSWGPRPEEVQEKVMTLKKELATVTDDDQRKAKNEEAKKDIQLWYAKDKTKSIQKELLETIEELLAIQRIDK